MQLNVWLWYYGLKNIWYDKLYNKVIHLRKECMDGIRIEEWMVAQIRLNECMVLQDQWIVKKLRMNVWNQN